MESDEQYIAEKIGRRTPFTVPTGFMDNLQASIIENVEHTCAAIHQVEHTSVWMRCRKYVATAAIVVIIVYGTIAVYMNNTMPDNIANQNLAADTSVDNSDYAGDNYVDYTMLDNDDIYSLLASN